MLSITILSGGSGNDRLVRGLKSLYKNCDIKVITNMYDSGKSTGICRSVTDTLGVSDVRKNHSRMYETLNKHPNKKILEFYNNRYDLKKGNELKEVIDLLTNWDLCQFIDYAKRFFNRPLADKYDYNDFSIANIIYSEMYSELGYEKTNNIFCNLLGIDDFVIINSFDNVYLKANTEDGSIIDDEGYLVDLKDPFNKITDVYYSGKQMSLNQKAIDRVLNSDLIVISTGTFWSSIYPTLHYLDFYKYVNESKAKKIWAMNNEEDKDAYGVSSLDFINHMDNLGLNLNDFTILENLDASSNLKLKDDRYHTVSVSMGNDRGKHDGYKYAKAILSIYYNLYNKYDKIIFDFDDTIWSRDYSIDSEKHYYSINNIININKSLSNISLIISGNTFDSIKNKLFSVFGTDLNKFNVDVWADANSILFRNGEKVDFVSDSFIQHSDYNSICDCLKSKFNLSCTVNDSKHISNIKIKPLGNLERSLLFNYLNDYLFNTNGLNKYEAKITGRTTVDIVNKVNSKKKVFEKLNLGKLKVLYIGDELDSGNDKEISSMCSNAINVESVEETNAILKLLIGDNFYE